MTLLTQARGIVEALDGSQRIEGLNCLAQEGLRATVQDLFGRTDRLQGGTALDGLQHLASRQAVGGRRRVDGLNIARRTERGW